MKYLKSLLTIGLLAGLLAVTAEARGGHGKGHHGYKNDSNATSTTRECRHYDRNPFRAAMQDVNLTDEQESSKDDLKTAYRDAKDALLDGLTRSEKRALRATCQADVDGENDTCVALAALRSDLEASILALLTDEQVDQYEAALAQLEETCSTL